MNSEPYGRFIFIGFEDLKKIKFDKLEQVCDKVYVFINREEKAIPLSLVQRLQKLGENVQWIAIEGREQSASHFMGFYLGLLHEQSEEDIEFSIISNDNLLDSLIDFINEQGRSCVRVTQTKQKDVTTSDFKEINRSIKERDEQEKEPNSRSVFAQPKPSSDNSVSQQLSERIARETIKRLVMSGNRPAAIDSLKSYILLQYNNPEINKHIDYIINKLEKSKEIEIKDKEVVYNF